VPFDTDPDWPPVLKDALMAYRAAWRAKQDEIDAAIAANAQQVPLVDKPEKVPGVVRVSGPFTVEGVFPVEESEADTPIGGAPDDDLDTFAGDGAAWEADPAIAPTNAAAFRDEMLKLLREDGVRFPDNRHLTFTRLDPASGGVIHAEGEWQPEGAEAPRRVAVSFGPQHGNVSSKQVQDAFYDAAAFAPKDLLFAGFGFDAAAQADIERTTHARFQTHLVTIRPDVAMKGLLKNSPGSQLFTVFGRPRARLITLGDGQFRVVMEGVDIYDPVKNVVNSARADKVAAWFLDRDFDGRTFCITQAFFPDKKAWVKLAAALKGTVADGAFEELSGTQSLPFSPGEHRRAAVKVIDPRGNEVLRILPLDGEAYER
jgi:adenine-specific DNA-methyltransferase